MGAKSGTGNSKRIHDRLVSQYVEPARRRGQKTVCVVARDIARDLDLRNRYPQICTAMEGQRFLLKNGLKIVNREGPRQSSTVAITYLLSRGEGDGENLMDEMYGRFREAYAVEGGGEASLRRDRATFEREPGE